MATTALPYLTKLHADIKKSVNFKVKRVKSGNNYVSSSSNGLAPAVSTYDLKYVSLTQTELDEITALFATQATDSFISWTVPVLAVSTVFKPPTSYEITKRTLADGSVRYWVSFQLITYY